MSNIMKFFEAKDHIRRNFNTQIIVPRLIPKFKNKQEHINFRLSLFDLYKNHSWYHKFWPYFGDFKYTSKKFFKEMSKEDQEWYSEFVENNRYRECEQEDWWKKLHAKNMIRATTDINCFKFHPLMIKWAMDWITKDEHLKLDNNKLQFLANRIGLETTEDCPVELFGKKPAEHLNELLSSIIHHIRHKENGWTMEFTEEEYQAYASTPYGKERLGL